MWDLFRAERQQANFTLNDEQLFVSRATTCCRKLRRSAMGKTSGDCAASRPGGPYLDRRLLIGEAAVRVLAPLVEHNSGNSDSLPAVPERGGYEIGEIESY